MTNTHRWTKEPLEVLVEEAARRSREHFPREMLFAAPSQKHYDTGIYQNQRKAFLTMSVTGDACGLGCDHCGTKVLQGMLAAKSPARFQQVSAQIVSQGAQGVLVSGGCLDDGSVPLDRFIEDIGRLKAAGLTVLVHTGIVRREVAQGLKAAGVDQILLDIIGDNDTIRDVYHLERTVDDYRQALAVLREEGLPAVPHVVVGLHYGEVRGEYQALQIIAEEGASQLVIVVLQPLPGTAMAHVPPTDAEEVGRVLATARVQMPDIPLSLGCAKPAGPGKRLMEQFAVDVGVQSIAYPLPATVRYAEKKGYRIRYHEQCCSIL